MGARGGAVRVRAFKCTSCDELYAKRAEAVRCCNDGMAREEEAKREAAIDRAKALIRVRLGKDRGGEPIAVAACPRRGCQAKRVMRLRLVESHYLDGGIRREVKVPVNEALKKVKGLVVAQVLRHMRSYGCDY